MHHKNQFALKKLSFAFFALSFAFILFPSCKKTQIEKNKQIVLRFSEPMPQEHPGALASTYFANLVNKQSNQRINIKIYYNGQLGSQEEVIEQMQFAGIAMSRVNISVLLEKVLSFSAKFREIMYDRPEKILNYIQENQTSLSFACQTEKMIPLGVLQPDYRCFYSDSMPIPSITSVAGKRIGITENIILTHAIEKLKAKPVSINSADIYSSLINGYMNARESALCDFLTGDEYPFINHVLVTSYISLPDVFVMSAEVLADFSTEDRMLLIKCAEKANEFYKFQHKNFLELKYPGLVSEKSVFEDLN